MISIQQALIRATEQLNCLLKNKVNAEQEARWLLAHILSCSITSLFITPTQQLTDEQHQQYAHLLTRRIKHHEPLAYILGTVPFADLELAIRPPILIPRPETEQMVLWLIEQIKQQEPAIPLRILDLCTGSGCIALALAYHLPHATVVGVDINKEALTLAEENAKRCNIDNVSFVCGDLLCLESPLHSSPFHLIISNPPYISDAEYQQLDKSVREWEDERALRADENGLLFYKIIAQLASQLLAQQTAQLPSLVVEIGHTQKKSVSDILTAHHFSAVVCHQDLFGVSRWLSAAIKKGPLN